MYLVLNVSGIVSIWYCMYFVLYVYGKFMYFALYVFVYEFRNICTEAYKIPPPPTPPPPSLPPQRI